MSKLTSADFQEKYSLLLDIYDLIKRDKPVNGNIVAIINLWLCNPVYEMCHVAPLPGRVPHPHCLLPY